MTNSATILTLSGQPVPEDRECVRNLTEIIQGVQDFVVIDGLSSQVGGSSLPNTNNTAAQALETAQEALALAEEVRDSRKERRSSATAVALPAGDSAQVISWTPALPNTLYNVSITFVGTAVYPSAYYGFHVVNGTQTTTSVQLRFNNIPSSWAFTYVVDEL